MGTSSQSRPQTQRRKSSRPGTGIRRWLLLYRPARSRAWLFRLAFYALTFLALPLLSLAALGAYFGPDRTFAGIPAVVFILFLAVIARRYALRADATLEPSETSEDWCRISEAWPFPLADPPPRRPVHGYLLSIAGMTLMLIGHLGAGLAANGVAWPILIAAGASPDLAAALPAGVTVILGIVAVVVGVSTSVCAVSAGTRLRDRGRRLRARDARFLVQQPGERPVLLLRSFDDEELVDPRPVSLLHRRYEERLSSALSQLGPVITVGRPGDALGFSGAARFYVSQDDWQRAVRYLMTHAAAVVITVGRSEGLWWEIRTAFECASREHLLFFFPPVDIEARNASRGSDLIAFLRRWNAFGKKYRHMEAERRARYQLFRERTAAYLGDTLPADLNDAFFFDFLAGGKVRVLRPRYAFLRNFMPDLIPRFRRFRFDMKRTLWPFMAKLYQAGPRGAVGTSAA